MDTYIFKLHLIDGGTISLEHCDDELVEDMLETFKHLDKDDFFEQGYGQGGFICVPVRNILYVDTYPWVPEP